ncbi:MAG TPA: fibronectin type III domain-containing protein, partial [Methylomirabilota bacterium]|nr:fibronectin type III domain-containing protein [Methylomirabilota bacterium]
MKTPKFHCLFPAIRLFVCLVATVSILANAPRASAAVIVNVVETGGDNEATDTVPAKWTGVTYVGGIANEPVTGLPAGSSYTVLTFSNNSPSYVDRNHRWTHASATVLIPSYLIGAEYIMIGNDNRDNAGLRLDVTVNGQVRCYLLIDNRLGGNAADPPTFSPTLMSWVTDEGWAPVITGVNRANNPAFADEIGIDEGADGTINNWNSIYAKDFAAGTFQLKQPDNAGQNMYGVVIVGIGPSTPPPAPDPIAVINGDAQVTLTWSNALTATGYNVKRASTAGGPYSTIGSLAGTSFTDSPLVNGTDYFYVVSGTNILGEGTNSLEVVGQPNAIVTGITAAGGTNQVTLNWTALAGASSYSVLRSGTSNGTYSVVASGIAGTSHLDTTAPSGSVLFYRISADLGASGVSGQSESIPAVTAPGAPVVTASLFAATVIRVGWIGDAVVSGFNLEQSPDGVNFSPLAATAGNQSSYLNTGLAPSTTYFYRVQASNETGLSGYSAIVSDTTPAIGYNINIQLGTAPIPPGYLKDIGDLYGDRTNGFFYGWTNVGNTNITVDARHRNNPASPDLR